MSHFGAFLHSADIAKPGQRRIHRHTHMFALTQEHFAHCGHRQPGEGHADCPGVDQTTVHKPIIIPHFIINI